MAAQKAFEVLFLVVLVWSCADNEQANYMGNSPATDRSDTQSTVVQMAMGQAEQNHGEVTRGDMVVGSFLLHNDLGHAVAIESLEKNCTCTSAAIESIDRNGNQLAYDFGDDIMPGGCVSVTLVLDTGSRKDRAKAQLILHLGESSPPIRLSMLATVVPPLKFDPPSLDLSGFDSLSGATGRVTISSDALGPIRLSVPKAELPA